MIDIVNQKFVDMMRISVERLSVVTDDGHTYACTNGVVFLDDGVPGMTFISSDDRTEMVSFNMKHVVRYSVKLKNGVEAEQEDEDNVQEQ